MDEAVTFRPHRGYLVLAWVIAALALVGAVYLGVSETRGARYVLFSTAICGLLMLFPVWVQRSWIRVTEDAVIHMNMWPRTYPLSTIRSAKVDPNLRYAPVVLKLTNGKRIVLAAATAPLSAKVAGEVMRRIHFTDTQPFDERPLTDWEHAVVETLSDIPSELKPQVRESLPYLVVTGACDCGCASFKVRDSRFEATPHQLFHYSNGVTASGVGFALFLGPNNRPISIDVDNQPGVLPDPGAIRVSRP
jgi:hypothetical protein